MTEETFPKDFVMHVWNKGIAIGRYEISYINNFWNSVRISQNVRHTLPKAKTFDSAIKNCLTNFGEFQPFYTVNIGIKKADKSSPIDAPVRVGQEIEGRIDSVGAKGDGILRVNNMIIFVPGGELDKVVKVRITRILEKNAFGEIIKDEEE